jgi:hypothetical protein
MSAIRSGTTCLLSSAANALAAFRPGLTEDLIFLAGRGNRLDYRFDDSEDEPSIYIGHHSIDIVERFCERFGVGHELAAGSPAEALEDLRASLVAGNPVLAWVDMPGLHYLPAVPPPGSIHAVTIAGEAEGMLRIEDYYVPSSLYSRAVRTHEMTVPFADFAAWSATGHLRHRVDFAALGRAVETERHSLLAEGMQWAIHDYLRGSGEAPATLHVLQCLAADLPEIHRRFPGREHSRLYSALAYNIRYFGFFWSREFMADALDELSRLFAQAALRDAAGELRECALRWQAVMLGLLKLPLSKTPELQIDRLRQTIFAALNAEIQSYQILDRLDFDAMAKRKINSFS